jgi:type VI secretion system protein ImpC
MPSQANQVLEAAAPVADGDSLLDQIVEQSKVAKSSVEHERAKDIIVELVSQVLEGTVVVSNNLSATLDARLAELDRLISSQLSAIMHAPAFQKLEQSWTGLHYLVKNSATGQGLKIRMLNATKRELVKDFQSALEFDQSTMFKKVYEEEFGTFGGSPYAALLGDFEISRQPEDMYFIEQMSHVAAASHAPFVASASPELFGLETYGDLGKPRDLSKVFDTVEYAKWKAFRESEDSRYVGLALPRFLGRLPFNPVDGTTVEGFNFVEEVDGTDHQKYLWCNAAYAFGAKLTKAFDDFGWCAAIRGVEGGGWWTTCPRTPSRPTRAKSRSNARPRWRSPTAARRSSATLASSRWSTARTPPTPPFSARSRRRRQGSTTRRRPTPTPCCRRNCNTSSPSRASPTT